MAIDDATESDRDRRILVTGATGMIGGAVLEALPPEQRVIAMVRDPSRFRARSGVEVRVGDFDDPASIAAALEGVGTVFLVTNSSGRVERQQVAFVDIAERAGVGRIVYLSQLNSEPGSPVRFLRYHAIVEQRIRESSIELVAIRPNLVLQAFLDLVPVLRSGTLPAPAGDAPVSMVDVRDIAAVSAAALVDRTWTGILDVTGPRAVTHADLAAALSAATGSGIEFDDVAPSAYLDMLRGTGMPEWQAEGLLEDYAHYARGEAASVSSVVERVTGRFPRTVADFAGDYAGFIRGD